MKRLAIVPAALLYMSARDARSPTQDGVSVVDSAEVRIIVSESRAWTAEENWGLRDTPRLEIGAAVAMVVDLRRRQREEIQRLPPRAGRSRHGGTA